MTAYQPPGARRGKNEERPAPDYPPGYEPGGELCPPYGPQAWAVLDMLPPSLLPQNYRYFLAGAIAQVIEDCVDQALAGKPKPLGGLGRRQRRGHA
jgi:hypothetical protein